MNFTSVSGKKWIFKQFNVSDIKKYSEQLDEKYLKNPTR